MPLVQVDGIGVIDFPDSMSEGDISNAITSTLDGIQAAKAHQQAAATVAAYKPNPYEAADIASMTAGQGKAETGMESGTEFTAATAGIPALTIPSQMLSDATRRIIKSAELSLTQGIPGPEEEPSPEPHPTIEDIPDIKLPRVQGTGVIPGLVNTGISTAEGLIQPESLALLPAFGGGGSWARLAATVFGAQQAAAIPPQIQQAVQVLDDPNATAAQRTQALAAPGISALFSGLMLHGGLSERPGPVKGPAATGEVLPMPRGAVPSPAAQAVGAVGEELAGEPTTKLSPEAETALQEQLAAPASAQPEPAKGEPNASGLRQRPSEVPQTGNVPESGESKGGEELLVPPSRSGEQSGEAGEVKSSGFKPPPMPEKFDSLQQILAYRESYRQSEIDFYKSLGLTDAEANKMFRAGDNRSNLDVSKIEDKLTPENRARLDAFSTGEGSEMYQWDRQYDPAELEHETDKAELARHFVQNIARESLPNEFGDKMLHAVVALRKLKEVGGTWRDVANELDQTTTRASSSQGDKTEVFKLWGSKLREFAKRQGIDLPLSMEMERAGEVNPAPAAPEPARAEPVAPVVKAAAKVEAEVQKVAATEGQRPAKEVKAELLKRIEDAMHGAPEKSAYSIGEHGFVEINIPGDGHFKVPRNLEALSYMRNEVKKISTSPTAPAEPVSLGRMDAADFLRRDLMQAIQVYGDEPTAYRKLSDQLARSDELGIESAQAKRLKKLTVRLRENIEIPWRNAQQRRQKIEREIESRGSRKLPPLSEGSTELKALEAAEQAEAKEKMRVDALLKSSPEKGPGMVGLGGAAAGEVQATGADPDIFGVRQVSREKMEKAGQPVTAEPGTGISVEASIEAGRATLAKDPGAAERVRQQFRSTGRWNASDFGIARAKYREVIRAARRIEEQFGTDSPENKAARDAAFMWSDLTKDMATDWNKSGMGQQAEEDIDTGSIIGLETEYRRTTGQEFNPGQRANAGRRAADVAKAEAAAQKAKDDLARTAAQSDLPPAVKTLSARIAAALDKSAASALDRIKARRAEGRLFTGIDPEELTDYAIYGASKLAKGAVEFGAWSADMVKEIGDYIRPHLKQIWDAANKHLDDQVSKAAPETMRDPVKKAIKTPASKPADAPTQRKAFDDYESGQPMTPDQVKTLWQRVKGYLDQGADNRMDTVSKVASDLGLPVKDVLLGLAQDKGVKRVADEVWQKQRQTRIMKQAAKRWLAHAQDTWLQKSIPTAARVMFTAKTGLHGTVALGTHAPLVLATHPIIFGENFGKMYKLVLSPEFYEQQVHELAERPNYDVAQRAGLVNDMSKMEDFSDPALAQGFPKLAEFMRKQLVKIKAGWTVGMGTRGYSVLKILRQDLFDHAWDALSDSEKNGPGREDIAKAIADSVNHMTGVVKTGAHPKASLLLFAPKLELSRLAVVGRDPWKAANSLLKADNMTPAEKWFAMNQVKEKAKIFSVATGLLLANQQLNNLLGDKKKLNGIPQFLGGGGWNPMASDFMKFRVAGMNIAWGSPFLTMMRLPLRLIQIGKGDGGKTKFLIYPDESMYKTVGSYLRTQESPLVSPLASLLTKADWQDRPLPQIPGYGKPPPVPKRLAAQGIKPYTWPEFVSETMLPIPFEEGAKEVWHYGGLGNTPAQQRALMKSFITTVLMGGTGARVQEDWQKR